MTDPATDLNYIKETLKDSEIRNSYPMIYVLWGVIIFVGYAIADINTSWLLPYWIAASICGAAASTWIGFRQGQTSGQLDKSIGDRYLKHFGVTTVFIFTAAFTGEHNSILLILGVAYCLAGIHFDRAMLYIGLLIFLVYVGSMAGWVPNNTIVGLILAASFFVAAWRTGKY